jgi:peroxiredoxin Q/BCP
MNTLVSLRHRANTLVRLCSFVLLASLLTKTHGAAAPTVGTPAPNLTLQTIDGRAVELKALAAQRPVVLVMLRGWPTYQCPVCSRQARDFIAHASEFARRGAQVLMVYPGPSEELQKRAREFLDGKDWPKDFLLALDPDYAFTNAYGLRWDAPKETAYPATFIISREGRIQFAQISKSHGGRTTAAQVLQELK